MSNRQHVLTIWWLKWLRLCQTLVGNFRHFILSFIRLREKPRSHLSLIQALLTSDGQQVATRVHTLVRNSAQAISFEQKKLIELCRDGNRPILHFNLPPGGSVQANDIVAGIARSMAVRPELKTNVMFFGTQLEHQPHFQLILPTRIPRQQFQGCQELLESWTCRRTGTESQPASGVPVDANLEEFIVMVVSSVESAMEALGSEAAWVKLKPAIKPYLFGCMVVLSADFAAPASSASSVSVGISAAAIEDRVERVHQCVQLCAAITDPLLEWQGFLTQSEINRRLREAQDKEYEETLKKDQAKTRERQQVEAAVADLRTHLALKAAKITQEARKFWKCSPPDSEEESSMTTLLLRMPPTNSGVKRLMYRLPCGMRWAEFENLVKYTDDILSIASADAESSQICVRSGREQPELSVVATPATPTGTSGTLGSSAAAPGTRPRRAIPPAFKLKPAGILLRSEDQTFADLGMHPNGVVYLAHAEEPFLKELWPPQSDPSATTYWETQPLAAP